MVARIYRPAKTAMQSGTTATRQWVLEYEPESKREVEPLMGWTSSRDMKSQIKMYFPSKDEAVDYAQRNGITFVVNEPKTRKHHPKSYADNFRFGRIGSWTH
jgi:hypothetical protein